MRYKMNRNDLKEYFAQLKKGQQDSFTGETELLSEMNRREKSSSFEYPAYPPGVGGAIENLAADIQDMIDNAVGQVDLNFSNDPLTKWDILDFVIRMLVEEKEITPKQQRIQPSDSAESWEYSDEYKHMSANPYDK